MKKSLFIAASLLALATCSRETAIEVPVGEMSITAKTETSADTKTIVEGDTYVYWEPGDVIAVFSGGQLGKFTTDISESSATATFKGTLGVTEDADLWAVYPFSEDSVFDGETITTTLPSEQIAREGSFGKNMNLAVAHSSSNSLQFYNVGGGIRFSVTEEGIKKVMFEGLSGEIISGKVKIGLEDGLPVVKEVSGGSQFITLLPPSGKETFEPGTWYYIIAIPGALKGGYKLRFYKDSDYARKVSEKKVVIKRSIFGNLEKADSGIEYESMVTKFPETEEEIVVSNSLAYDIAKSVSLLTKQTESVSTSELAEKIKSIDGVIQTEINEDETAIIIQQRDNSYLNYLLKANDNVDYYSDNTSEAIISSSPERMRRINKTSVINHEGLVLPKKNNVILISPFQSSYYHNGENIGGFNVNRPYMNDIFTSAGYSLDTPILDENATLDMFDINHLCQYGIIIIRTHGVANAKTNNGERTTAFLTRSRVPNSFGDLNRKWFADLSRCLIYDDDDIFYSMTVPWLKQCATESTSFEDALVFIGDCEGMKNNDMRSLFFDYGAAVCCGYSDVVAHGTANFAMYRFFNLLTAGAGRAYSAADAVYSQDAIDYQTYMEEERKVTNGYQLRTLFRSYINPQLINTDFYLYDSTPFDLKSSVYGASVVLEWDAEEKGRLGYGNVWNFMYQMPYLRLYNYYSVFIDGKNVNSNVWGKQLSVHGLSPGEHSWYVVTKVINDGEICSTFQSEESSFLVEDQTYDTPQAVDLGLSIRWGTFNLGASRPEQYGQYFAWGEIAPKLEYSWNTYKWCDGSESTINKYTAGFETYDATLESTDDVVQVKIGGKWRMPTLAELYEISSECDWKWDTRNGVNGYIISGRGDFAGNCIFLPAAGAYYYTELSGQGESSHYWCSTLYDRNNSKYAGCLYFDSDDHYVPGCGRAYGLPIRPVFAE